MNDSNPPLDAPAPVLSDAQFVSWLREVAPYVHAHRGRTFVVGFGGELIEDGRLNALVHDLSLLQAMGIRLVLVHGSRPQVQKLLALRQVRARFAGALRITDAESLECVKEAAGGIRLGIEAAFSQGLPNTPMANSRIRIVSGNFVVARPVGILDGIDLQHTGVVRKVDVEAIRASLDNGSLVLLPPLGFSPTGEAFNLTMQDVAASAAVALKADKFILIGETQGVKSLAGELFSEISAADAERLIAAKEIEPDCEADLSYLLKACRGGVSRAHLIPGQLDGALLIDLFTHSGVGTMLTASDLEALREATSDDLGGILRLITPLEDDGTLVKRPREFIEREIGKFSVLEHDGVIFGCAALFASPSEQIGEMACLTVHPDQREAGDGERLLRRIEARARAIGLKRLFVLTTRTTHWFLKRGFTFASVDDLPAERQGLYNWQRRSQILIKTL
ncbi:MAG TPA: amino-acid N-acetyltransferase [Burkholderiaceae bacterium]|nr:amino-acid N-acetyltransferase [Burkholderiaceae bacterium]